MDQFLNAMKGHARGQAGTIGQPRMAEVMSYNDDDGTAKVRLQPEGVITGWLPTLSQSVGASWGLHVPLRQGDQVMVLPQDGDAVHGVIIGRVFSDKARPPSSSGSDAVLRSSGGGVVNLMTNGTVKVSDASGSSVTLTNDGKVTHVASDTIFFKCASFNVQASVNVSIQTPMTNISQEVDIGTGPLKVNNITVIVP